MGISTKAYMLYALNGEGEKVPAMPRGRAFCPVCGSGVIAKCGSKVARHWAHKHSSACDLWSEETAWHVAWKSIIRKDRCEVVLRHGGVTHRADIVGNRNTVIELQHSSISPDEIRARERFYGKMVWVFDAAGFFGNMVLAPIDDYVVIAWYYPRTALLLARKPVYLHLPCGNILKLEHTYPKRRGEPLRAWGRIMGWKPFYHLYLSSVVGSLYKDGEQPEAIKSRVDIDFSKLKFHHGIKIKLRCGCDSRDEYPNCGMVCKSADNDHIRRALSL
jgi:competence protein CoiA